MYIVDDFNINLIAESNNNVVIFFNIMYFSFLYPMLLRPSRIIFKSCNLINKIFFNNPFVTESGLIVCDISDRLPVFLTFPVENRIRTSEIDIYSDLHCNKCYISPHDIAASF